MPQYTFICLTCEEEFDTIVKLGSEIDYCISCGKISERVHGQDLPSPAQIEAGVGGVYAPKFGERKYS
jgi:hypothetical protein